MPATYSGTGSTSTAGVGRRSLPLTAATCHRAWSEKFASTPRNLPRGRQNLPFARPQEPHLPWRTG